MADLPSYFERLREPATFNALWHFSLQNHFFEAWGTVAFGFMRLGVFFAENPSSLQPNSFQKEEHDREEKEC
jgi:hypothetical protein